MKYFRSFALSLFAITALLQQLYAQPGITKVTVLTDSVKDALDSPKFSNAPAIVRLPIVEYVSKTIPVVEVKIEGVPYRFIFDTGASNTVFNSIFIVQSPGDSIVPMGVATGANSSRRIMGVVKASNFELGEIKVDELMMTTIADKTYFTSTLIGFYCFSINFLRFSLRIKKVHLSLCRKYLSFNNKTLSNYEQKTKALLHPVCCGTDLDNCFQYQNNTNVYQLRL